MNALLQDLRYGLRMLVKDPGFTTVAVLTLALGIGATTAIFSVVYGVLLRSLPYPKPEQLVSIKEAAADGHLMQFTDPNFNDLRASNRSFAGMAKLSSWEITVSSGSVSARVGVASVSRDFFHVMGVAPMLGRAFSEEELHEGGRPAAIASYGYWQQHLDSATDLSQLKLRMENRSVAVVGVMPPGFGFPAGSDLWTPAELWGETPSRTSHNWAMAVARLRDGVNLAQARSEMSALARGLYQQYKPEIDMRDASVMPLRTALTAAVRPALVILLACVGFLLLVACANVANLLLARAAERQRELAVRAALGAGRGRLIRQFLAESLLLSLTGSALGVLLAVWGVDTLLALAPASLPRLNEVSINLPVLEFALGICLLVAVGLGVLTALRATATEPQAALAEGSRGSTGSVASQRLARGLVGSQVAVTLVLLAGAALLGRSLLRVLSVNPGFRTANIVTMELEVPGSQPTSIASAIESLKDARPAIFMSHIFDRLRSIPGVEEAGAVSNLPLGEAGDCADGKFLLLDREPQFDPSKPEDQARFEQFWTTTPGGHADYCVASEGYFKALAIPLLSGRLFDERDGPDAPQVAVVTQSIARATWPGRDPLGQTIEFGNMDGDMRLLRVVGVVADVHFRSLEKPPEPTVYVNYRQRLRAGRDINVVLRAAIPPNSLVASARRAVQEVSPDVAPRFQTFQDVFSASLATRRFNLTLVGIFAATALLLAVAGIYGVMAYSVVRRTHEIGVRMALGASAPHVLRLVLSQGMLTTAVGLAIGIAGAFVLTRAMQSLLFGVSATDPLTLAGVALLLGLAALLATYVPARRATQVDPMVALRHE